MVASVHENKSRGQESWDKKVYSFLIFKKIDILKKIKTNKRLKFNAF